MLHDLLAQDFHLSLLIDVSIGMENSAKLERDSALDLPLGQHLIGKLKFFISWHVVFQDVLEEGLGTQGFFSLKLGQVFGPHI